MEQRSSRALIAILFLTTAISLGAFFWSFFQFQNTKKQVMLLTNPEYQSQVNDEKTKRFVQQVSKHLLVPTSTPPIVWMVEDPAKLAQTQDFFADVMEGDVLLVYPTQAILYRPATDILVRVGPVEFSPENQEEANTSPKTTDVAPVANAIRIEIRNGSRTVGAGAKLAEQFSGRSGFVVAAPVNAAKNDYPTTQIVNLSNKNISQLESFVQGDFGTVLPAGEQSSTADVVIIIGNDR